MSLDLDKDIQIHVGGKYYKQLLFAFMLSMAVVLQFGQAMNKNIYFHRKTGQGYRLKDNVVKVLSVGSIVDCGLLCLRHVCCKSLNYRRTEQPRLSSGQNCELCNVTSLEKTGRLLKELEYIHYDIIETEKVAPNHCCSSLCPNGALCDFTTGECLSHLTNTPVKASTTPSEPTKVMTSTKSSVVYKTDTSAANVSNGTAVIGDREKILSLAIKLP